MADQRLFEIIGRITPQAPEDMDDLVYALRPRPVRTGADILPTPEPPAMSHETQEDARVTIGIRLCSPLPDAADYAMRLAALAAERDADIVILSALDYCGLERFGFRVERVVSESGQLAPQSYDDLRQFWKLDLIL